MSSFVRAVGASKSVSNNLADRSVVIWLWNNGRWGPIVLVELDCRLIRLMSIYVMIMLTFKKKYCTIYALKSTFVFAAVWAKVPRAPAVCGGDKPA